MERIKFPYEKGDRPDESEALAALEEDNPDAIVELAGETPPKGDTPGFYTALLFESEEERDAELADPN